MAVFVHDTTHVTVAVRDTTHMAVMVHDTTQWVLVVYDTTQGQWHFNIAARKCCYNSN